MLLLRLTSVKSTGVNPGGKAAFGPGEDGSPLCPPTTVRRLEQEWLTLATTKGPSRG